VQPLKSGRKHLRDLIIYEMNIDDFTSEYRGLRAPLDAVTDKLDYLVNMGFNAVLFMPWTAWKYRDFDWGYEPFQYFAVEYRYANDLEHPSEKISWLKKLVGACHERDIHVIMDGVFNHASTDFPYKWLYRDAAKCPYTGDFGGTFPGLQDLNFNNSCTPEFIRDVCLYWIDNFKIDGIRFDNTVNFYISGNTEGLLQ
jgi:pullulanase/glycogen debranching enzyme